MDANLKSLPTRREVLATVAVTACAGLGACHTASREHKPAITTGTVNIGPATDYPAGTASTKFVLDYGIVITNDDGTVLAIHPKCTHMGCPAAWKPADAEFQCPCHGSRFDILGRPTKGPAKKNLPAIAAVPGADNTLTVDLDKLYAL